MMDRDFVLVEFIFENQTLWAYGDKLIKELASEKNIICTHHSWDLPFNQYIISTKMDPMSITALTLSNAFLAERMRISYIPDDLKNKYRQNNGT